MDNKIQNFKELRIWQMGIEIVKNVYGITSQFPKNELFVLTSQIRRAAISIPSNIAEGFKRIHKKEFIHFLYIALGSAAELETQLIISQELGYAHGDVIEPIFRDLTSISKMITVLIHKLEKGS